MGGRRESEAGLGVPGKLGCADVTGRAIWLERFKKRSVRAEMLLHTAQTACSSNNRSTPLRRLQRGGLPRLVWPQRAARSPRSYYPVDARLAADAR